MTPSVKTIRPALKAAVAAIAVLSSSPVFAQGFLADMLGGGIEALLQGNRQQASQNRERQEVLDRVSNNMRIAPNSACALPRPHLERLLPQMVNQAGLMDNISRTVFNQEPARSRPLSGYEALMEQTRTETARRSAETQATYRAAESGGEVPVGQQATPQQPRYRAIVGEISAISRMENGLECSAAVEVDFLRFPITYIVVLDPSESDGWNAQWRYLPDFDEAHALQASSPIRIAYAGTEFSLAQAREQAAADRANANAARIEEQQREAARIAYENSPAGRAEARREQEETEARRRACEANGGTWGMSWETLIVGCYFLRP